MSSTIDPDLRSFIAVSGDSHFPIQNLPFGVFRTSSTVSPRIGVAIGSFVLDLSVLEAHGLLDRTESHEQSIFSQSSLNSFLALGRDAWRDTRSTISHLLQADVTTLRDNLQLRHEALIPMDEVTMLLPMEIGDYTDFYSSRYHATNIGSMMRPDNPLMPNWVHLPVAYHGRSSSIVVSGTDVHRPCGQRLASEDERPQFGPSRLVDFELEVGFVMGSGNSLGEPIAVGQAIDHVFGIVLVNDWSARDIQKWEYAPLGPFLAKNFATSISPWVVPIEALEPFQVDGPAQDPEPLPYLKTEGNPTYDLNLEVSLTIPTQLRPERICASNLRHIYWNVRQQVAHHTATGCNLRPGDLLATGTVSGPTPDSRGCLLELTWGGKEPLQLPDGETRRFLEDGDLVTMTGWCQGDGYRVGLGEVQGKLLPSRGA